MISPSQLLLQLGKCLEMSFMELVTPISMFLQLLTNQQELIILGITLNLVIMKFSKISYDTGSDVLKIRTTDPNFVHPANYYIGTRGFIDTTYTMLISHNTSEFILVWKFLQYSSLWNITRRNSNYRRCWITYMGTFQI